MTEPTDLVRNHRIIKERVPGSAVATRDVVYFRGEDVVKLLQSHVDRLNSINERLQQAVAKHKGNEARLADARKAASALYYHHKRRLKEEPDYEGSPLYQDSVAGLAALRAADSATAVQKDICEHGHTPWYCPNCGIEAKTSAPAVGNPPTTKEEGT